MMRKDNQMHEWWTQYLDRRRRRRFGQWFERRGLLLPAAAPRRAASAADVVRRRRARRILTGLMLAAVLAAGGTAALASTPGGGHLVASGSASRAVNGHVHGVCHNPSSSDHSSDLLVYCVTFYPQTLPPPQLPRLHFVFKVHTNHTPEHILLVMKVYKWPAHGDHAHIYAECVNPEGHRVDCDHSWVTRNFPEPGHSKIFRVQAICQPGRYYVFFQFHGVTSGGTVEDGHWYDPHPSNKSDRVQPNRMESHEISQC